ncbi:TonB-dependent receptor plug domain-containing protein [Vibrio sp. J1-1]|uniref:TonB-dependent receptor plug domain-containing protein n=1 Tax=Vibrio sp. J1-1 TaxID=2912251 RepID=UPI001F3A479C|nr:TonB-dependent receptor plug domain-containing protein [Vibrio sp. J1-1]MCF7483167.1 TonB-dependent receptor plug domain-containing protein [Vibrio sp. J1-1]
MTKLYVSMAFILYGPSSFAQEELTQTESASAESEEVVTVIGYNIALSRLELEQSPQQNPTLSQALKHDSRVGINDAQTSMQGGDLTPEEISLSGARPHQTKYTIDGVGVNNSTTFTSDSDLPAQLSSGHTSGYFVDTNLVDGVEVLDHNISAEHGGFTGGVVNANLRKPTEEFTIDYQYSMNDSDWNASQKVGENFQDSYGTPNDGSGKYQPNFQKRMHSLHLGGAINENQKLAVNVSHQKSEIPLANSKDVDQRMDNIFITHIWESSRWRTTTDVRYTEHESNSFMNDSNSDNAYQENSETQSYHTGVGATFKLDGFFSSGHWQSSLSYDRLSDKRKADSDYFVTYMIQGEDRYNFHNEGSYGNLKQTQDSYQLKSAFNFASFNTFELEHKANIGIEINHQVATVDRPQDHVVYQYRDLLTSDPFISTLTRYQAANYDADAQQYSLYIDDNMQWGQLGVYLGGRVDHMSVFDKTVFSPRFTTNWDFDSVNTNRVTLGANRYYSANLLSWALQTEQRQYQSLSKTCDAIDGNWNNLDSTNLACSSTTDYEGLDLSDADIPYSDELSASWAVDVNNFAFNTVYIYRKQRDGLTYSTDTTSGTATLYNNLKTDNHIISLEASTINPYEILGGYLNANWKIAYNHRKGFGDVKNTYDASNDLSGGYQDEWVLFDGELVRYNEMDVSGYQSPIKTSLDFNMYWQNVGLVWNNRVNYQAGKNATAFAGMESVDIDGETQRLNSLLKTELDDLVTWDMAVNWTPTRLDNHVILGLSVTNLLNTQKVVSISGSQAGTAVPNEYYNTGRQIWLNVNLRN